MERSLQALNRQEKLTVPALRKETQSLIVCLKLSKKSPVGSGEYLSGIVVQASNETWAEELIPVYVVIYCAKRNTKQTIHTGI